MRILACQDGRLLRRQEGGTVAVAGARRVKKASLAGNVAAAAVAGGVADAVADAADAADAVVENSREAKGTDKPVGC